MVVIVFYISGGMEVQDKYNEYDEISLRELIETLIKGKFLIAAIVMIALIISIGSSLYIKNSSETVKQIVSVNFDGADSGLNPDGTPFDINLLRSSVVLNSAMDNFNIEEDVSINDIRKSIDIRPIVPVNITDIIESRRKAGEEYNYYPSDFVVYFKSYGKLGISDDEAKIVLETIVDEYYKYFNETYSERIMLSDAVGSLDYDGYDYSEISSIVHKQIEIIENYLDSRVVESKEFRSINTGLSFGDMRESADIIKEVDLKKFDSIVSVYKLTKNKRNLITNYQYLIEQNELEQAKKKSESSVAIDMMTKYDKNSDNLLLPGVSGESIKMSSDKSYYDDLAKRATESAVEAENKGHDIQYIREEIEKLREDGYTEEVKNQATKEADEMLGKITLKIDNLIDLINNTSNEYFEKKMSNSITKVSPAQIYSDVNVKLNLAIALVLGLMIGVFVVFFREYWKKSN